MVASVIGLSVLCFLALLVAGLAGVEVSGGFWTLIAWIPYVGLPIGFIFIVVLLLLGVRRRSRAAKVAKR